MRKTNREKETNNYRGRGKKRLESFRILDVVMERNGDVNDP